MAQPQEEQAKTASLEDPQQLIQAELEETTRSLKEITLMLESILETMNLSMPPLATERCESIISIRHTLANVFSTAFA